MDKKNVIWILGDQHRAQALSCNGDENVYTPNIDELAVMGINCVSAVSGNPLCCPFRGSMLTGVYPHKCVPGHEIRLPETQKTIAHVFNEAGYDTAYFGKWHLDGFHESVENRAAHHIVDKERRGGFKHWVGYENNNSQQDVWVHGDIEGGDKPVKLRGYETDVMTDMFIDYITKAEDPFFAVLSVQPPHDPYSSKALERSRRNHGDIKLRANVPQIPDLVHTVKNDLIGYYGMIENLDWNVGRITEALRESGKYEDTHIIFFSDHGDMHGSHGMFRKTNPYEEAVRIPFIISGEVAGGYNGRRVGNSDILINHVDIAPTTLGLCGIEKPDWMEGTDYSYIRLEQRKKPENLPDSAYLQSVIPTGHYDSIDKPWRGIVTDDGWKYVCFEENAWLMFDLNNDPYELCNLAHNSRYKEQRLKLHHRLEKWIEDTDDAFKLFKADE